MTGRSTKGLHEKGHGIGNASLMRIAHSMDVAQAALYQASEAAMGGSAASAKVAIDEAFLRQKQVFVDLKHAAACESGLPCDCEDCATHEERISDIRAQRLEIENRLLRNMQEKMQETHERLLQEAHEAARKLGPVQP